MTQPRSIQVFLFCLLSGSCGSNGAVPDTSDAAPPACDCPAADTIYADRITRYAGAGGASQGGTYICDNQDQLLAGSCIRNAVEPDNAIFSMGFEETLGQDGWLCAWRNPSFEPTAFTNTAVCLEDVALPQPPMQDGCECLPPQPIDERIIRVEQAGSIPAQGMAIVTSQCDPGAILIGGSCVVARASWDDETNLFTMGFAQDDGWQCAWNNPYTATFSGSATAICVQPPAPGTAPEAEPLADRVIRKEQVAELPAANIYLHEATCDPGDFLLWGSCTLENPTAALADVTLFRSGFLDPDQDRPNTWQCAWNNPTDQTPAAVATAVCLKPLANP